MTEQVTLGYWDLRGLAQRIRLLMEYLHIPYNQVIFTPETRAEWFQKLKPEYIKKNPAANLPYLIDGDKLICETHAIMIHLIHKAKRLDLLGQTADDQVLISTVMGVFSDLYKGYSNYIYGTKNLEEMKNEFLDSLKPSLTKLEQLLGEREWYCGKLTYVDIIIGDFAQVMSLLNENFPKDFPRLKALQERMWQLEGIKDYLKSQNFKERPINYYPIAKWY